MREGSMRRNLPMIMREAAVMPATVDDAKRSVELVWSTGAKVRRYDWWNERYYEEELSLDEGAVDLSRLEGGAPLLNAHNAWDLAGQIGVVERAWIAKGEGRAIVRFSARDEVTPIWNDVKAGIVRNVSVGYAVRKYEIIKEEGKLDLYRAVDWMPMEISLVPVPADAGAGTRARSEAPTYPCEFVNRAAPAAHNQEVEMTRIADPAGKPPADDRTSQTREIDKTPAAPPVPTQPASTAAAESEAQIRAEAAKAERARAAEIQSIARMTKLDEAFVRKHVEEGTAIEQVRIAAFAELAKRSEEGGEINSRAHVVNDREDTLRERALNATLHRINPKAIKLEDGAREFRGLTLLELGRDLLERRGVRTRGMSRMDLATAALGLDATRAGVGYQGVSDLANVLASVMNKTLRRQYDNTPRTFTGWARQSTNPDFKTISRTILSGAPSLLQVAPSGEYKRGAVTDGKETYQLATYGRTVAFSRQALINDDLQALQRMPELFGRAAADLESDTVYAILTANAALADGVALFHANHGNTDVAGAIAVPTLNTGRSKMRAQKGLEGRLINVAPAFLIVPAAIEQTAYQYTSSQFLPAKSADVNEFRAGGRTALEPIVEPRLDAASTSQWYLSADPAQIDTVEYCYLEGNEGVYTESRVGFEVDGVEMKVRHDFAAKALDYRGLFRNG